MSLEGSLELDVAGVGQIWFARGRVAGFAVGRGPDLVDALCELLRVEHGTFRFVPGAAPPAPSAEEALAPQLARAQQRQAEWHIITQVVPSLQSVVRLVVPAGDEPVVLDRAPGNWSWLLAKVGLLVR
jgi:hypothetical protein